MALVAVPIVAVAVITLAATGVMSTLAQFTASINNDNTSARAPSVGLTESQDGKDCPATGNGQWTDCPTINKYGGGSLPAPGGSTEPGQTVTLENTGDTTAQLYLLPSACTDSLEGANGPLCSLVEVEVTCTNEASLTPRTLVAFFEGREFPTGYPMGTINPGSSNAIECTFILSVPAGETIPPIPTSPLPPISQPISWRLTVIPSPNPAAARSSTTPSSTATTALPTSGLATTPTTPSSTATTAIPTSGSAMTR